MPLFAISHSHSTNFDQLRHIARLNSFIPRSRSDYSAYKYAN